MTRFLVFLSLSLLAAPASAEPVDVPPHRDTRVRFTAFDLSNRVTYVSDSGFDPYSAKDALVQGSLGFSRTTSLRGPFSFAPGFRWDFGSSSATARGATTSLLVQRLTAPLEGRFHAYSFLYGFARIAPGMLYQRAQIDDPSMPEGLRASRWVFAGDVSVGASIMFASFADDPTSHAPRFWLTPELGYAWAASSTGTLKANVEADDPRRFGATSLESVAVRGPFFRIGVTTTF